MVVLGRLYKLVLEADEKLSRLAGTRWGWVEELAVLHLLLMHSQAALDFIARLVAELGYAPSSTAEAIDDLKREGLLSEKEHILLHKLRKFRNVLVHEYTVIDMKLVRYIVDSREYKSKYPFKVLRT